MIFNEKQYFKYVSMKCKGFSDGNGSRYGAKYFLDEDAVLVTFQ